MAASLLTAAFHMLRDGTTYTDLGADHFQRTSPETRAKALAMKIQRLGFSCTITTPAPQEATA